MARRKVAREEFPGYAFGPGHERSALVNVLLYGDEFRVMGMTRRKLYHETYRAAMELVSMRLWEEYDAEECFAVEAPGEEHPAMATIMGQAGQEYGLSLTRGPDAYRGMCALFEAEDFDEEVVSSVSMLGLSMEPAANIPPDRREFLNLARAPRDPDALVPFFLVKEPGRQARDLNRDEVSFMLYVLRGIIAAYRRDLLEPDYLWESGRTLTLIIGGDDPLQPNVLTEWRQFESGELSGEEVICVPPEDLWDLRQHDAQLLVSFRFAPMTITDDDHTLWILMVLDEGSEQVLATEPILGGDAHEAAEVLFDVFRGESLFGPAGIPSKITFTSRRLSELLEPALDALGVESSLVERHPALEEAWDSMCRESGLDMVDLEPLVDPELAERIAELAGREDFEDLDARRERRRFEGILPPKPPGTPAEDDLQEWKDCDFRLCRRAANLALEGGPSPWALKRYFGDQDTGWKWIKGHDEIPMQAFIEWCWMDYRPTYRSKTVAEKLLEEDLEEYERRLVEGRISAHPTIYRVDQIDPDAEEIVLEDVLVGGKAMVQDHLLSRFGVEDMYFCGRVYPAGNFNFVTVCGPQIAGWQVSAAIDYLMDHGMELTPEGLEENANLLGHLWEYLAQMDEPTLVNFDGDPLYFSTAWFDVRDSDAVRAHLGERQDIQDEGDEYVWFRDATASDPNAAGDVVLLGRLWFEDDGAVLKVETNSVERMDRALDWLEALGELQFVEMNEQSLEDLQQSSETATVPEPLGGGDLPEDLKRAVEEEMRRYYMEWIDTPLPALDGKTPREACETQQGRARVAAMIRSTPPASGPDGGSIPVPREEMFKELGLEGE